MFRRLYCAGRLSTILAFAGAVALAIAHPLWAASCVGPAALEARVQSHPSTGAYEALGIWFGENDKSECAAQAFQARSRGARVLPKPRARQFRQTLLSRMGGQYRKRGPKSAPHWRQGRDNRH